MGSIEQCALCKQDYHYDSADFVSIFERLLKSMDHDLGFVSVLCGLCSHLYKGASAVDKRLIKELSEEGWTLRRPMFMRRGHIGYIKHNMDRINKWKAKNPDRVRCIEKELLLEVL